MEIAMQLEFVGCREARCDRCHSHAIQRLRQNFGRWGQL